jgi:hypothetical protein
LLLLVLVLEPGKYGRRKLARKEALLLLLLLAR